MSSSGAASRAAGLPRPENQAAVAALTVIALTGFAANSLLCRMALRGGAIDAASFTTVRLVSGALVLNLLLLLRGGYR
ncbi:MAG: hypothetical protein JWR07_2782, partial [Nevskia sp.]|nr:hypothetical protein [Nevskia sp.]